MSKIRDISLIVICAFLYVSVILLLYGGVSMFRLSYALVNLDGLLDSEALGKFVSCEDRSRQFSGLGSTATQYMWVRCAIEQSPTLFIVVGAGFFIFLSTTLSLLFGLLKRPSGIYYASVLVPVAFLLTWLCGFAMLQAIYPVRRLIPCDGMSQSTRVIVERTGLVKCISDNQGRKESAYEMYHYLKVFFSGFIIAFFLQFALIALLTSYVRDIFVSTTKNQARDRFPGRSDSLEMEENNSPSRQNRPSVESASSSRAGSESIRRESRDDIELQPPTTRASAPEKEGSSDNRRYRFPI